jgi:omega-6 fatty acid desaturase (delta-12 desaturase)
MSVEQMLRELPTRRDIIRAVAEFASPDDARGTVYFVADVTMYAAAIAGVLFLPDTWMKLAASIFAGMAQARLLSLSHDAAHGSLLSSRHANQFVGIVCFTLIHYNYRLWCYEHHRLHHPNTNDAHPDAYTPLSKAAFDRLPPVRKWLERFYRAPNIIGWGVYYILQRYWWTKILPPSYLPANLRPSAWRHSILLLGYLLVFIVFLAAAPLYATSLDSVEAIVIGAVLPFFVFETHNGFALYVQHTDPGIPWFKQLADRNGLARAELISVDLRVPRFMAWFYHDIFAHPVHHVLPVIPCYQLRAAQDRLNDLLGPAAVIRELGVAWWLDTTRRCKLYDWDLKRWLDFNGDPTTEPLCADDASKVCW